MRNINEFIKIKIDNMDLNSLDCDAFDKLTSQEGFGNEEWDYLAKIMDRDVFNRLVKESSDRFLSSLKKEDIDNKMEELEILKILMDAFNKEKSELNEDNIDTAKRIIPRIAEDKNGRYYIEQQLKNNGSINFGDMLNAYNYFVLGD